MLVFCCKLHRNLMIHENVMLQLHGKTHTKWVFSKNPHVFTCLHFFCKNKWRYCTKKQLPIMRIWWFLQYEGCMHTNKENTACSEWKYTFQRNSKGNQEGKSARGRGVGPLLLHSSTLYETIGKMWNILYCVHLCVVSAMYIFPTRTVRISYKNWHLRAVGKQLNDDLLSAKIDISWMDVLVENGPVETMWIRYPKDHWTLKTGHFEDPNPAKNRFRAPSIGGS